MKMEDLDAGVLKTGKYARLDMPSIPKDQVEEFSKFGLIGVLRAYQKGLWTVSDEWNRLLRTLSFLRWRTRFLEFGERSPLLE